jgi:Na+/H+ antiporter NhaD/arsenite permease-like protein
MSYLLFLVRVSITLLIVSIFWFQFYQKLEEKQKALEAEKRENEKRLKVNVISSCITLAFVNR